MSKYQALIDALEAGPTDGPWSVDKTRAMRVRNASDETITSAGCTDSLRHEWEANAAYIAEANPSTIRALLADLERAENALREVIAVFDSNPSSICDTVWITGNRPETLHDHCQDALAQMAGGR